MEFEEYVSKAFLFAKEQFIQRCKLTGLNEDNIIITDINVRARLKDAISDVSCTVEVK